MSATSHDALLEIPGLLPGNGASAPGEPDPNPTEDIADEVTVELEPEPLRPALTVPALGVLRPARTATERAIVLGPGSVLRDRYVLELPLGSGGSATVYRALDLRREADVHGERHVAIKLLRPENRDRLECIARLQREFRQTEAVAHPNVVRFHDLDCDRGAWFIVMELLSGESLARRLRRAGPAAIAPDEALRIALAVGAALAHAHGNGVTHGDVKPGNIVLTPSGEVRLVDFGAAAGAAERASGAVNKSPASATRAYASPEVLSGAPAEPADDVFSLARVTYQMLGGTLPRDGDCAAASRPAALDPARWQALSAALETERARRPAMAALLCALRGESERAPEAHTTATAPAVASAAARAPPTIAPQPQRRPRFVAGAALAAGLALVLGIQIGRLDTGAGRPAPAQASQIAVAAPLRPAVVAQNPPPEPSPPGAEALAPQAEAAASFPGPTGLVTFDAPTMRVSKRAVVAAIPLRHLTRVPRSVEVSWRLVDGTARAGRDYGGPSTGVETFVAGNSFRILYVPIVVDPGADRDRTFVVELTGATAGAEIGGATRVEVTILGAA